VLWASIFLFAEGKMTGVEQVVIHWLSVVGGFGVGFVLTHFLVGILSSFVFKSVAPAKLKQFLRIGGGIAAAILVYFLLLPSGGNGPGGSGDMSISLNGPNSPADQPKKTPEEPKKEIKENPAENSKLPSSDEVISVTVLEPNAEQKWYLYGDEKEPMTIKAVLDRIDQRDNSKEEKPIKMVRIITTGKSSDSAESLLKSELKKRGKEITEPPELDK
jgi:hypothetical protein